VTRGLVDCPHHVTQRGDTQSPVPSECSLPWVVIEPAEGEGQGQASKEFVDRLEKLLGRPLRPKKKGRNPKSGK
jgi:hypothetical protein